MKTYSLKWMILIGICMGLAAQPAAAFLGLNSKTEPKNLFPHAVNHSLHPTMVIRGGILARDFSGRWTLSGVPLVMEKRKDTPNRSTPPTMIEGRQAYVMGQLRDGVLMVHYVSILDPDQTMKRGTFYESRISGKPKQSSGSLPQ